MHTKQIDTARFTVLAGINWSHHPACMSPHGHHHHPDRMSRHGHHPACMSLHGHRPGHRPGHHAGMSNKHGMHTKQINIARLTALAGINWRHHPARMSRHGHHPACINWSCRYKEQESEKSPRSAFRALRAVLLEQGRRGGGSLGTPQGRSVPAQRGDDL